MTTPPADDRTPAGYDPDGALYYPTTVGQLGLCGPRSDDTSVGPDAARHTPPTDDQAARAWIRSHDERITALGDECNGFRVEVQHFREDAARHEIEVDDLAVRNMELSGLLRGMARRAGRERRWGRTATSRAAVMRQHARNALKQFGNAAGVRQVGFNGDDHFQVDAQKAIGAVLRQRAELADERARLAAARALADKAERERFVMYGGIERASGQVPSADLLAALGGPGALSPAPKDSQAPVGPAEAAGLCPECGSEPDPTPLVTRPDMVECQHHCGAWVRPDADPAVTSALDWWHRRVREEEARRLASDTAAHRVLAEWSRMHPSGYLAMYPAMDALRAAVAATPVDPAALPHDLDAMRTVALLVAAAGGEVRIAAVDLFREWEVTREADAHGSVTFKARLAGLAPALIGTWADLEFRAHQDHKHAVDGCGFCPSEEDR